RVSAHRPPAQRTGAGMTRLGSLPIKCLMPSVLAGRRGPVARRVPMRMPLNLLLISTALLALVLPGATLAQGWHHDAEPVYDWAQVVRVEPIVRMVEQPSYEQQCWDE